MARTSMPKPIVIIDYGMGNLSSVFKAIKHLKADAVISHSPRVIQKAEKIILPGVGAFGDAMHELHARKLVNPILEHIQKHKKFLGICLGLQLLFESSEENRGVKGLGILKGKVQKFRTKKSKVPHMGWNQLTAVADHPMLNQISASDYFYFVHSYYAVPEKECCYAESTHGGEKFTAIAGRGSVIAAQFHPEKSQDSGLALLDHFIQWT